MEVHAGLCATRPLAAALARLGQVKVGAVGLPGDRKQRCQPDCPGPARDQPGLEGRGGSLILLPPRVWDSCPQSPLPLLPPPLPRCPSRAGVSTEEAWSHVGSVPWASPGPDPSEGWSEGSAWTLEPGPRSPPVRGWEVLTGSSTGAQRWFPRWGQRAPTSSPHPPRATPSAAGKVAVSLGRPGMQGPCRATACKVGDDRGPGLPRPLEQGFRPHACLHGPPREILLSPGPRAWGSWRPGMRGQLRWRPPLSGCMQMPRTQRQAHPEAQTATHCRQSEVTHGFPLHGRCSGAGVGAWVLTSTPPESLHAQEGAAGPGWALLWPLALWWGRGRNHFCRLRWHLQVPGAAATAWQCLSRQVRTCPEPPGEEQPRNLSLCPHASSAGGGCGSSPVLPRAGQRVPGAGVQPRARPGTRQGMGKGGPRTKVELGEDSQPGTHTSESADHKFTLLQAQRG